MFYCFFLVLGKREAEEPIEKKVVSAKKQKVEVKKNEVKPEKKVPKKKVETSSEDSSSEDELPKVKSSTNCFCCFSILQIDFLVLVFLPE